MDQTDYRFSLRDVRQYTGWDHTRLKIHLARFGEMEYLFVHHGGRGQSFVYELVFEISADGDRPVLPVLIGIGDTLFHRDAAAGVGDKKRRNRERINHAPKMHHLRTKHATRGSGLLTAKTLGET